MALMVLMNEPPEVYSLFVIRPSLAYCDMPTTLGSMTQS